MTFQPKIFNVVVTLTFLSIAPSSMMQEPLLSLWGKVAEFTAHCPHWKLKPHVFIPSLDQFTICLHLKFKFSANGSWTAFTYHHPEVQCGSLGLGGREGAVMVWLFGSKWTTVDIGLATTVWHSLCLTWSHTEDRPLLYVNGNLTDLETVEENVTSSSISTSCYELAPNGTLTLGSAYSMVNSAMRSLPSASFLVSLFRLWGRQRSSQEVNTLSCTEGDLVHWSGEQWDKGLCAPICDDTLTCEWSDYKVSFKFTVSRYDGDSTDPYLARDIAARWVQVLPKEYQANRVLVDAATRSSAEDNNMLTTSSREKLVRFASSNANSSFNGTAYMKVSPKLDVATVQQTIHTALNHSFNDPDGPVKVQVFSISTQITPIDNLPAVTTKRPPVTSSILTSPFTQTSTSMSVIAACPAESQQTRKGLFEWPVTPAGKNSTLPCPKNTQHYATRHCKLSSSTQWMAPNLQDCHLVVETILDLNHVKVTPENALAVVKIIESLLSNRSELNYPELAMVLAKLKAVVDVRSVTADLGQALIGTISDILGSHSYLLPFISMILNITEAVGDYMVGFHGPSTLVAPALAVSIVDVVPGQFDGLTFGVSPHAAGAQPEIILNKVPLKGTVAFISLPSVLQHSFPHTQSPPRVQFQFYGIPDLFMNKSKDQVLNSFVVSASISNVTSPIQDLREDVQVMLLHLQPKQPHMDTQCVYWNFNKNDGNGGWDPRGCRKYNSSTDFTTCLCDHLTHFGVLLDVSRTPVDELNEHLLTLITYVGCGVSSLFLGITVLTYTAFEKLRRDYPSQILVNLSVALLGLNLAFLLDSWLSSWGANGLCVATAATLHYFLLASFTWMGLEGVNMYFALIKVFNVYVPAYILKFCALGWGIPLVICVLVLIVKSDAYGGHLYSGARSSLKPLDNSDNFCWLQDDVTFYVSVVAYALLVYLFNIAVFVVVLIQIHHMRANSPAGARSGLMHDFKGIATLTLLLGLTWTAGFFTWGPARVVMLYIFSLLNTLQGFFIFLFHCLLKENVRRQWRVHLCLGKFRLEDHSEWSHTASVATVAKPSPCQLNAGMPSVRSVESSSTVSTSASSGSNQRGSSCKRPDLGLFVKSLVFPPCPVNLSGDSAEAPHEGSDPPTWLEEPTPDMRHSARPHRHQTRKLAVPCPQ
ncbi:adhesion G-protein coupled receptor G2 isoform X2 [Hippocampus comes]|uniref:adhesion G-protein coupled receptor G2 isoform X2 n=1 Tax=Hippocampus comes TaxID=109280 RepID=UPI00094EF02D|nr:PREDICTED: adhesion G-protein coupled receptor G2-like isoform X2 [Hippocampus comes]